MIPPIRLKSNNADGSGTDVVTSKATSESSVANAEPFEDVTISSADVTLEAKMAKFCSVPMFAAPSEIVFTVVPDAFIKLSVKSDSP